SHRSRAGRAVRRRTCGVRPDQKSGRNLSNDGVTRKAPSFLSGPSPRRARAHCAGIGGTDGVRGDFGACAGLARWVYTTLGERNISMSIRPAVRELSVARGVLRMERSNASTYYREAFRKPPEAIERE